MQTTHLSLTSRFCLLVACAGVLTLAACADNSPVSPSTSSNGGTAVIEGTVTGGGSTAATTSRLAGNAAPAAAATTASSIAGLIVRIVGTNLSTPVDASGAFRIAGVPPGTVRLQFRNDTVDATTELTAISGDQLVQLQVQFTSPSAVLVSETRINAAVSLCHVEGNGTYHAITISTDAEAAHRAHGDGKVGDPVPGQPGKTFSAECVAVGPSVDIEKSTNGVDADTAPGPSLLVGTAVTWSYLVTNTGTVALTGILVVDDRGVTVDCAGKTTLAAGAAMTCTGSGVATLGQYSNVGTVTANWTAGGSNGVVTDSDASHYLGVAPDQDSDGPKVTLCHTTGRGGFYITITVSEDAEAAHRAHGDGKIGEPIPGLPGKSFGAGCTVQ